MDELGIVGREPELARVESVLDRGGALLLEGPAGIGKSTVIAAAVSRAQARGWTVLHCRPTSAETGYAYSGLSDLLTELPEIPAVQRRAIEAATHRADASQPLDAHVVAAATVSVLRAFDRPVLVVVDDLQWLDPESEAVLAYASRRAPVALLVARRGERPGVPPWGLRSQMWLSGLSVNELHDVVFQQVGRSMPGPALTRLHSLSLGNPLLAIELAKHSELPKSLVPPRPPGDVLLAAAAMTSPTVEVLRAAFDSDVTAELEAGELAGLIEVDDNRVTFVHPLFAAVIYGEAPAPRRRAVHRRLAEVTREPRHLALGTIGPDESLAQMLEDAGSAVDLLTLSLSKTPSHVPRGRRVVLLASALFSTGDLTAARELLDEEIPSLPTGPVRARALMIRGTIAWYQENAVVAAKLLESALDDAKADQELTGELHSRLSVFHDTDRAEAHRHACAAVAALSTPEAHLNLCYVEAQLGMPPSDHLAAHSTVDCDGVPREAERLTRLGEVELVDGNLTAARDYANAALRAAMQLGQPFADPTRRLLAFIDAHAGELDKARQVAEDGADRAEASGALVVAVGYLQVLAFIAASEGDPAAVVRYTERSRRHLATMHIKEPIGRDDPAIERICALAELGRLDEASAELAEFEQRYAQFPRPWMEPVMARARALITGAALEADPQWGRFDQARALLLRGRLLRRTRQPGAAAAALAEAVTILSELNYPVWVAMANDELARVSRRRSAAAHLSETEQRVAELVVTGMTTKQVAATLFMSPRTVESHVARAYRKLGIRSRAELGRVIG